MRTSLAFLVLFVLLPASASGQQWTEEQQEVLTHIQACWDAWETKDFDRWVDVCRPVENVTYWWGPEGAPGNLGTRRKAATSNWATTEIEFLWNEMRPVAIQMSGYVAIVHLYAYSSQMRDGERQFYEQKRLEIFRKVDGSWTFLGGMATPEGD